ncbi:unnamed protein product [Rotaria socialis]
MYTFEGIALVLPVRQKMREPDAYGGCNGVLNTGILTLPADNKLYQFTNIMYAVAIFWRIIVNFTYHLHFFGHVFAVKCYITIMREHKQNSNCTYSCNFYRCCVNSKYWPFGAVASTALSVILPPICETITFWPNKLGRFKWQLILNLLIIMFGVYVFIAGTTLSMSNIVACIREEVLEVMINLFR